MPSDMRGASSGSSDATCALHIEDKEEEEAKAKNPQAAMLLLVAGMRCCNKAWQCVACNGIRRALAGPCKAWIAQVCDAWHSLRPRKRAAAQLPTGVVGFRLRMRRLHSNSMPILFATLRGDVCWDCSTRLAKRWMDLATKTPPGIQRKFALTCAPWAGTRTWADQLISSRMRCNDLTRATIGFSLMSATSQQAMSLLAAIKPSQNLEDLPWSYQRPVAHLPCCWAPSLIWFCCNCPVCGCNVIVLLPICWLVALTSVGFVVPCLVPFADITHSISEASGCLNDSVPIFLVSCALSGESICAHRRDRYDGLAMSLQGVHSLNWHLLHWMPDTESQHLCPSWSQWGCRCLSTIPSQPAQQSPFAQGKLCAAQRACHHLAPRTQATPIFHKVNAPTDHANPLTTCQDGGTKQTAPQTHTSDQSCLEVVRRCASETQSK